MTRALYLIKDLMFACGLRSIVADELSWGGENVSRNWRKWCQPISQVYLMKPVWTRSVLRVCVRVCVCVCARARVCACTVCILSAWFITCSFLYSPAAAAVKSLQSCPTLCDPIDGSLLGSPVPGILQARTLECVAISCSNAWKWKVKVKSLSRVWLSDPMDCSLPGSSIHGIFQARVLEWGAIAFISQRWSCPWANVSSMLCSNCPLIHQLHVNKFVFLKPTSGQNLHME